MIENTISHYINEAYNEELEKEGFVTKNFLTDEKVKLFVEKYSKADVLNEALNQARVEENTNLSIPKLLEVTKMENRWALITEYVDGTPLNVLIEKNPEKENEYLETFINIQLEILSKKVPLLTSIKDKFRKTKTP